MAGLFTDHSPTADNKFRFLKSANLCGLNRGGFQLSDRLADPSTMFPVRQDHCSRLSVHSILHRTARLTRQLCRYRRNPHQMNWWARNYGYYQPPQHQQQMYRLNADLTSGGRVVVQSAAHCHADVAELQSGKERQHTIFACVSLFNLVNR
jgi:hypothetical protein